MLARTNVSSRRHNTFTPMDSLADIRCKELRVTPHWNTTMDDLEKRRGLIYLQYGFLHLARIQSDAKAFSRGADGLSMCPARSTRPQDGRSETSVVLTGLP